MESNNTEIKFSAKVKNEVASSEPQYLRHCEIAALYAIINNSAEVVSRFNKFYLYLHSDNFFLAKKFDELLQAAFNSQTDVFIRRNKKNEKRQFYAVLKNQADIERIYKAFGSSYVGSDDFNLLILKNECCKRAYLREIFISNASISDPNKSYHLEYSFSKRYNAKIVLSLLEFFSLKPKLITRKNNWVVYIKDGEKISEFLGIIGAHNSLLYFESIRVFKDVSNSVNRSVNFETANMLKTSQAFVSCQEDIRFIEVTKGLSFLSEPLREVAELRLEYPNATLKEIGLMTNPPISKSGINHRLRKIGEIADNLRGE